MGINTFTCVRSLQPDNGFISAPECTESWSAEGATCNMHNFSQFEAIQRPQSPPPNYPGHIPLTRVEKAGLALGSAFGSLYNPYRGDLIAALGEATATPYFIYRLRDAMLASPTGRRILKDRPRLTSKTLRMEYLRTLPENTVGR